MSTSLLGVMKLMIRIPFIQTAQSTIQELRMKTSSLRQRVDEARASKQPAHCNKVLDSLTKLKQTGRIDRFHVCSYSNMQFTMLLINYIVGSIGQPRNNSRQI